MITYRDAPRGCTIGLRIINVLLDGQLIGYIKAEPGGWRYWPAPIRVGKWCTILIPRSVQAKPGG